MSSEIGIMYEFIVVCVGNVPEKGEGGERKRI